MLKSPNNNAVDHTQTQLSLFKTVKGTHAVALSNTQQNPTKVISPDTSHLKLTTTHVLRQTYRLVHQLLLVIIIAGVVAGEVGVEQISQ